MTGLHHLALGARDVEGLAQFYQSLFGLAHLKTHHNVQGEIRSIWLDLAPGILMIEKSEHEFASLPPMTLGKGPFLIAFTILENDRDTFLSDLAKRGLKLEGQTNHTLYLRDPEHNRVAVSWHPGPH
ncbi:MAG: glyoxalase [Myxococcales bacterium]|nr:glyoxalase [Myxococcales bacterium]